MFGGIDPNSGTASLLEIGHAIGSLRQLGEDAEVAANKAIRCLPLLYLPVVLLAVFPPQDGDPVAP